MNTDEWHKKRDALMRQLRDLEAGRISHLDEAGGDALNSYTDASIERVKQRLANLDARFEDEGGSSI